MPFKPTQKLQVSRLLSTGQQVEVGVLAQNRQGVYFQYAEEYTARFGNLSPISLAATRALQEAPRQPHGGIHGVFADSLPDAWGLLLQDKVFRQHGVQANQLTAMDRLAYVGAQGMGGLVYSPVSEFNDSHGQEVSLADLGLEAQTLFDQALTDDLEDDVAQVLAALTAAGSPGGARPKAQIFMRPDEYQTCRTYSDQQQALPEDEAWLVKFTSSHLPLGHEEGVCEAVYLQMAQAADLKPPEWKLLAAPIASGAEAWLALKRFDYLPPSAKQKVAGRYHMHSACGLLDADFRSPSLDYVDLIKASRHICQAPAVGQLQFRRAIFNLFAVNQDDHSKNWSFLQADDGSWQVAPFYDVTYSPHPFNEHATAFSGYGKRPPLKTIQKLARHAGFANWNEAKQSIEQVVEAISKFQTRAKDMGMRGATIKSIQYDLNNKFDDNRGLLDC